MTTTIIGAGPVGCYLAEKLARKGINVTVIEEHERIGEPMQCTGLVSGNLMDVIKVPDDLVLNKIKHAKFFFGDRDIQFNGKAFVLDRIGFDKYMYEKAAVRHTNFFLGEKYENFSYKYNIIARTNKRQLRSDFLVGADGSGSVVGRQIGVHNNVIPGLQVRVKGKFDPDTVELHFGEDTPEFFSWFVPENENIARVGLATRNDLTTMLKKFLRSKGISRFIDRQAGLIPIDYTEKFVADRIALVGDSAAQNKATTGGGITTGLISAKLLSRAIIDGYEKDSYNKHFLQKNYVDRWKRGIGKELKRAYAIRKIMDLFSKKDYEDFYDVLKNQEFKKQLEENVDMEMYSKFLKKSIMTPAAVKFGIKFAFKHLEAAKYFISLL